MVHLALPYLSPKYRKEALVKNYWDRITLVHSLCTSLFSATEHFVEMTQVFSFLACPYTQTAC